MKWERTSDPNVIQCGAYFIRRAKRPDGSPVFVLGRDIGKGNAECLGGFDAADDAKQQAATVRGNGG